MENNFVLRCINNGGEIKPLIIPAEHTEGLGLMNPSIYVHNGKIIGNLRHVNYTFYHSEAKLFQHPYGPLTYLHPEDDLHLRTWNWYLELDQDLNITRYTKTDTSRFDTYEPKWDFVGLEDARVFEWEGRLFQSGVRRDTTTDGQGRMELSEIKVTPTEVVEVSRVRIKTPNDPDAYCEKNWMPILDKPYHYIKWSNPTEIVKVNPTNGSSVTVAEGKYVELPRDIRGGSQVVSLEDGYLALTHEVWLFDSETSRKDAMYYHRFIKWDKDWNIASYSDDFHFLDAQVEFSVGMVEHEGSFLITFGFQDNGAFVLRAPKDTVLNFLTNNA
jgi:hypothetical protein